MQMRVIRKDRRSMTYTGIDDERRTERKSDIRSDREKDEDMQMKGIERKTSE